MVVTLGSLLIQNWVTTNEKGENESLLLLYSLLQNLSLLSGMKYSHFFLPHISATCVKVTLAVFNPNFQTYNFPSVSRALFITECICAESRHSERVKSGLLTQVFMFLLMSTFSVHSPRKKTKAFCLLGEIWIDITSCK
jgi:hypothetical protein